MSRANSFGDLDDFGSDNSAKPMPANIIEKIAQNSGFPSRKPGVAKAGETARWTGDTASASPAPVPVPVPKPGHAGDGFTARPAAAPPCVRAQPADQY